MKTFSFLATAAALALTAPADAQLVGGGLGGGLGGTVGGLGGSMGGMLSRPELDTRVVDRAAQEARARAREERRLARSRADQGVDRATDVAEQRRNVTADADGAAGLSANGRKMTGSAGGAAALGTSGYRSSAMGGAEARPLGEPMLRTRGAVAASARGMRRVAATASGVPVFVPQAVVPAPAVFVRRPVLAYPAYSEAYYYGGGATVVIHETEVHTYMDRQQRDFERELAGTGASVRRQGDNLIVAFPADVTFAFDKADIQPRFYGTLNAFARTLNAYPGTDVEVAGHTDSVGSEAYNLGLSDRRGRAVADYLVTARTEPARLVVEAFGESEPIASNTTLQGRAANRRVELIVHPRAG